MEHEAESRKARVYRIRFWVVLILSIAVLGSWFIWLWLSEGKVVFRVEGVPFRRWLAERQGFEMREPLEKVGTNAVPHLIAILRRNPDSAWRYQLKQKVWNWLPGSVQSLFPEFQPVPDSQVRRAALFGLRFFGMEAQAALPFVISVAKNETNSMVRGSALVAALSIAPRAPETFGLWREEWENTNYLSRRDLAIYLRMPRVLIPAAVPYLLEESTNHHTHANSR